MSKISESGLNVDLPGEWTADPEPEPGAIVYREVDGSGVFTAMLLSISPLSEVDDKRQLLADYVAHRALVEVERIEGLVQYEEEIVESEDGALEALWSGESEDGSYQQRHRTILYDDVLVDACIGDTVDSARLFEMAAVLLLATVSFQP